MMRRIGYFLVYPVLILISLMPFWVLYGLSNILFLFLYYILQYRKNLVWKNLQRSFPDKTENEISIIRKQFFRYLADTILETIKTFTISHAKLASRFALPNLELVEEQLKKGRNVMIVLGHYGNWEWGAGALGRFTHYPVTAPFTPLRHPDFNRLMVRTRERYGINLLPKKLLIPYLSERKDKQHYLALIADQSPNPKKFHLIQFMNQETAVVKGMENIAREYHFTVFFASIRYIRRGYYDATFELLTEDAANMHEGSLTANFMHVLQRDIQRDPIHYLWSHDRWKLTTNKKQKH
jgi:KDO2-lipid IV(A) lauroyltransferase